MTDPALQRPTERQSGGQSRLLLAAAIIAAGAAGGCQREAAPFADPADGATRAAPIYQMPQPPDPYHMHPFNMQAG
jgi:hypothetical protein